MNRRLHESIIGGIIARNQIGSADCSGPGHDCRVRMRRNTAYGKARQGFVRRNWNCQASAWICLRGISQGVVTGTRITVNSTPEGIF